MKTRIARQRQFPIQRMTQLMQQRHQRLRLRIVVLQQMPRQTDMAATQTPVHACRQISEFQCQRRQHGHHGIRKMHLRLTDQDLRSLMFFG